MSEYEISAPKIAVVETVERYSQLEDCAVTIEDCAGVVTVKGLSLFKGCVALTYFSEPHISTRRTSRCSSEENAPLPQLRVPYQLYLDLPSA